MTGTLWTPATDGERVAWTVGYCAGHDTGYHHGHTDGRAIGYAAGREGFAGELATALRVSWAGLVGACDPATVHEVLNRPWPQLRERHIRELGQAERRRAWDRQQRGRAA